MKEIIGDAEVKKLDTTPPEGSKAVSSFAIEAQVENKPQELKKIRPFHAMSKSIPMLLKPEAQIVLQALFSCFERQKEVKEGKLEDFVWGFEQGGIPGPCTVLGIDALQRAGYIKLQAPDNTFVEMTKDNVKHLWVRYQPNLLAMVYS